MSQPELTKIELPICHSESGKPLTEIIEVEQVDVAVRKCLRLVERLQAAGMGGNP